MSIVSQIDVFFQSFQRSTIILQQFLLQFNFIRFNLKSMTLNQSMSSCLQASKKRVGYFSPQNWVIICRLLSAHGTVVICSPGIKRPLDSNLYGGNFVHL